MDYMDRVFSSGTRSSDFWREGAKDVISLKYGESSMSSAELDDTNDLRNPPPGSPEGRCTFDVSFSAHLCLSFSVFLRLSPSFLSSSLFQYIYNSP